jgi:hypothetical protein
MGNEKIVEQFFREIEKNNFTVAETLVSENFEVVGVGPRPLGAREFLGAHKAMNTGMPDFKFNYKIGDVKGNVVEAKVKLTGTHFKDMPAPIPGLKTIPATNKTLRMPEERLTFTIKDNKIDKLHLESVPGGGLPGVLKQLGVEIPVDVHH